MWQWGLLLHSGCCCLQTYFFRSQRRCIGVYIYPYFGSRTSRCGIKTNTYKYIHLNQTEAKQQSSQSVASFLYPRRSYCELCGKCSRWVMVTNGWFSVFIGVILLSASSVSIFFSRSINSRLSAFSARMSVPSRFVMFTCRKSRPMWHVHSTKKYILSTFTNYFSLAYMENMSLVLYTMLL